MPRGVVLFVGEEGGPLPRSRRRWNFSPAAEAVTAVSLPKFLLYFRATLLLPHQPSQDVKPLGL